MIHTIPYPTLPYPNPEPEPTPPRPAPLNPTTTPYTYPTLPPPHPTPPIPYSCPAIHRLALLYHILPYPTLPFLCICRFRCFGSSVVHSVSGSGFVVLFRSVSFRSVKVKTIGTDRMNSVKSVVSMPELSKLYNCRLNKCRIVTC